MKKYTVLPGEEHMIALSASTRAGLLIIGLQGLSALVRAQPKETDELALRPFSFQAYSFSELLRMFLDRAAELSHAHEEVYDDARFTLITDKKAEGSYLGKPTQDTVMDIGRIDGVVMITKDINDYWETKIRFKSLS